MRLNDDDLEGTAREGDEGVRGVRGVRRGEGGREESGRGSWEVQGVAESRVRRLARSSAAYGRV